MILNHLDNDTLDIVIGQFSKTDDELCVSCTCRTFYDILKKKRKNKCINTSIAWIASSNNAVKWTYENYYKIPFVKKVVNISASIGSIERIELVCKYTNVQLDSRPYCYAAMHGHIHVLKWLHNKKAYFDKYVCIAAAGEGHIHVLEWLHEKGYEWDEDVCTAAVGGKTPATKSLWDNTNIKTNNGGHYDTLLWLINKGCPVDYHAIISAAIRNNHKHILEWIRVNNYIDFTDRKYLCNEAIQSGHLEMLIYLRSIGIHWDENDIPLYNAALYGYIDIMDYLYDNGSEIPEQRAFSLCDAGAYNGHFKVVKWARAHGCEWDNQTFSYATLHNNLEMVKWLYENGCPWDENTSYSAAISGNIDILRWIHARGCPVSSEICYAAAYCGHSQIIIWALENERLNVGV